MIPQLFIIAMLIFSQSLFSLSDRGQVALETYMQGLQAHTAEQRTIDFNEALKLYLDLEKYSPPSGTLYYDIGNCYFQLGEYGLALYYYYKAQKLIPRDDQLRTNIDSALARVGLPPENNGFFWNTLLYFDTQLSLFEKEMWAIGLFFGAFTFFSFYIWLSHRFFRTIGMICSIAALLLLASLTWEYYFAPIEAVIIRTTALKRGPGDEYAIVPGRPVLTGSTVRLIEVADNGNWLKVRAPGEVGYVSKENARVLP